MSKPISSTSTSWEQIQREPVPSSAPLKAAILAATAHQAQQVEAHSARRQKSRLSSLFGARLVAGLAGISILFIAITTMLPSMQLVTQSTNAALQPISLQELELQELALLQDELLFSQL